MLAQGKELQPTQDVGHLKGVTYDSGHQDLLLGDPMIFTADNAGRLRLLIGRALRGETRTVASPESSRCSLRGGGVSEWMSQRPRRRAVMPSSRCTASISAMAVFMH